MTFSQSGMLSHCHDNRSQSNGFSLLSRVRRVLLCLPKWQNSLENNQFIIGELYPRWYKRWSDVVASAFFLQKQYCLHLFKLVHPLPIIVFAICINSLSIFFSFHLSFVYLYHLWCGVFIFILVLYTITIDTYHKVYPNPKQIVEN